MPPNPAQTAWCDAARGLLKLPARRSKAPHPRPSSTPHPPQRRGDAYGLGYTPFETGPVHPKLAAALESGKMLTAGDWKAAAPSLEASALRQLNEEAGAMVKSLAQLGPARLEDVRLRAVLDAAKVHGPAITESLAQLAKVTKGSPLLPCGSVGFPRDQLQAQKKTAKENWLKLEDARYAYTDPDEVALVDEWIDYWKRQMQGLGEAEENEQMVGYDPGGHPPPTRTLAANEVFATDDSPEREPPPALQLPTVASQVPANKFDMEIEAAQAKRLAMSAMHEKLAGTPRFQEEQQDTLRLVDEWRCYWQSIQSALESAQARGDAHFDPTTANPPIIPPDKRPTYDRALGDERIKCASDEFDRHKTENIDPITSVMQNCLPLLDMPQSNPERLRVEKALTAFALVDTTVDTQAAANDKAAALAALERELVAWNDRRTRMHLPPAAEAVALADLLQVEHRKMIDEVVARKFDLPLAGLTEEELAGVKISWAAIRDGTGPLQIDTGPQQNDVPKIEDLNPEAKQQFRSETLANLARLLSSASGRKLVAKLEEAELGLSFCPGKDPECYTPQNTDEWRPRMPDTEAEVRTDEEARAHKGKGSRSTITLKLGAKDSDYGLCTEHGSPLHTPCFIAMGHEMIHALHNARGVNRRNLPLTDDAIWSNSEELKTIKLGKLSEQTLRAEYGMSAERFGHGITRPDDVVGGAFSNALFVATAIDVRGRASFDEQLQGLGFTDIGTMTDQTCVSLATAALDMKLRGPFPQGWDANQLSPTQMRAILSNDDCRIENPLPGLGWSPFDLEPDSDPCNRLMEVMRTKEAHPRSPDGLQFRSLGGAKSLEAISKLEKEGLEDLSTVKWEVDNWPGKLAALQLAEKVVDQFLSQSKDIPATKGKLPSKLKIAADVLRQSNVGLG